MNKPEFLKSLTTEQLVQWKDRAEAVSGFYTYFDSTNNSTANFSAQLIKTELDRREDKPRPLFKKKKK
jgi:hypothetical protein